MAPPIGETSFSRQFIHIGLHAPLVFVRPVSAGFRVGFRVGFPLRLWIGRRLAFVRGLARRGLELQRDAG